LINTWLTTANIPNTRVIDVAGVGLPNQVAYIADTFNALSYAYVESLLRNNQTPTGKLQFAAGSAGKFAKVNAGGTDLEYSANTGIKAGTLRYVVTNTTIGQAVVSGAAAVIEWNTETDTEGAIDSFDPATDQFTLATGTYLLDISIPVSLDGTGSSVQATVILYDNTGASNIATATGKFIAGGNTGDNNQTINLKFPVKVTAATNVYSVKIHTSANVHLGSPASLGYAETYQQMSVLKLT